MQFRRNLIVAAALALSPILTIVITPPQAFVRADDAANLPSGKELMDKYISATGGRDAYARINNRTTVTTFDAPANDIRGSITITQATPNKAVYKQEIKGFGVNERGTDGETLWERDPATGVRLVKGPERAAMLRELTLNVELNWEQFYKSAETVGVEDVDGKPAYKVKLTSNDGSTSYDFFDKDSGLIVKTITTTPTQQGEITATTYVQEYKEFDGVKLPVSYKMEIQGVTMNVTIDKVEHNKDLPPTMFDLPEEVKKLKAREDAKEK